MTPDQRVDLLRAACCVAGADGKTTENEAALISKLAKSEGVGTASVNAMIERAQRDPDFCREQFRVLKADPKENMAILIEVAMADGKLTEAEINSLLALAENLEIRRGTFDQLITQVTKMLEQRTESSTE